jgi:hypothetical protein
VEHVGGLRDAGNEIAVRDHKRRVGRIGIGQKLERWRIGISARAEPDRIIGALGGDPVLVGNSFEGSNVGVRSEIGKFVANGPIEQVDACHLLFLPPDTDSRLDLPSDYQVSLCRMSGISLESRALSAWTPACSDLTWFELGGTLGSRPIDTANALK